MDPLLEVQVIDIFRLTQQNEKEGQCFRGHIIEFPSLANYAS